VLALRFSEQLRHAASKALPVAVLALAVTCWANEPPDDRRQATHKIAVVTVDPEAIHLPVVEGGEVRFERLRRSQGLSQQRVTRIVQDNRGFLWFGMELGLNRYDGYHFRVFKNNPDDSGSLCGVNISALLNDRSGRLWVGCDYALDRYDPITETFVHYRLDIPNRRAHVSHISQDRDGFLWVSTAGGLYRVDAATGTSVHFGHDDADPFSLSSDDVRSSGEDRSGVFWVATGKGVDAFDREHGRVMEHVPLSEPLDFSFYEDSHGVFWLLYASGNGLAVLDRENRHLTRYSFGRENLPTRPLTGVSSMLEDQHGTLWIGTFSDGLLKFDRAGQRFIRYRHDPSNPETLAEDRITTLFADHEGDIWVGLGATEPAVFSPRPPLFETLPFDARNPANLGETLVNTIYEDRRGRLWLGTTGALVRLDRTNHHSSHIDIPGGGVASDVLSIVEDRSGSMWVGTSGQGLYRGDSEGKRFKAFRHKDADPTSLSDDLVVRLFVDQGGTLWAGTRDALNRFDPATETFAVFRRSEGESDLYHDIVEDQHGTLWLGSDARGVMHFEPQSGRFTPLKRPSLGDTVGNAWVSSVLIDHSGALWAGTQNGLDRFDPLTGWVAHYSEKEGLAGIAVGCVLEDSVGALWLGTSDGVSRLDPQRHTFRNYSQADGLPGPDFTGWRACFRSAKGEMFFGGYSGAVAVRPETMMTDVTFVPPMVLTSFQLLGKTVAPGPGSPLARSINYTDSLSLSHNENSLSFEFSALSFLGPATNRYRFKLEGLDATWHEVGSERRYASYTTLPPGSYRFRVQGATIRGPWSEPGLAVRIRIKPPWWATWWSRTLFAMAVLLVILALYLLRVRQLRRQFETRMEARESERTRVARELHDTLLQSFQGLLLRLQVVYELLPARPTEAKQDMQIAIDRTVEAISEGRVAVQGLRASSVEGDDIAVAIKTLAEELTSGRPGNDVAVRVDILGTPRPLRPIVRDEIFQIGGEALRNALRHAHASRVEVELRYEERQLRVRVRDNGTGIDPQFLSDEGTAGHFGLHGMRERAELIGGKLAIWTAAALGSEIQLTVPAAQAYVAASSRRFAWLRRRLLGENLRASA